jgi:hypothetical protein
MRQAGVQVLTHTLRLPDEQQAAALRWLAFSRNTVNTVLTSLWPRLDEFSGGMHQAWKQGRSCPFWLRRIRTAPASGAVRLKPPGGSCVPRPPAKLHSRRCGPC